MPRHNVQIAFGNAGGNAGATLPLKARIDQFFLEKGLGFNPYGMRRARLKEIIMLEALSEEQLSYTGLRREDILPHVFSDILV